MKKTIISLFILLSLNLTAAKASTIDERSLWEKMLIKVKIKEDTAKSFNYSKLTAYSRKKNSRRVQARIKNNSANNFQWATFKVIMEGKEVYRFTVNNFKANKTYFFDSTVPVDGINGKSLKIAYVNSQKYK